MGNEQRKLVYQEWKIMDRKVSEQIAKERSGRDRNRKDRCARALCIGINVQTYLDIVWLFQNLMS